MYHTKWSLSANNRHAFVVRNPRIRNNSYTPKFLTVAIETSAVHLVVGMENMHGP